MSERLSSQAQTWLTYFTQNPAVRINSSALMSLGVSRRKSNAIISELIKHEKLKMVRLVGGGTRISLTNSRDTTVVVSDDTTLVPSGYANNAVQLVSNISNSYTARTTNKATNKFFDSVEEKGKTMGYGFFEGGSSDEDELAQERASARAKSLAVSKQELDEARAKRAESRKTHREDKTPMDWTCKDVAYEFADRLGEMWHIKPFSVIQSRFVPALSAFRKQHDTNGAIELEMMNMYFSSIKAEKFTDGNHLWRSFMYKAPELVQTARERIVTPEQVETAIIRDQELTNKKLSLLEDDDV